MPPKQVKSRIHLLAARQAPTIVILQRKRAKLFNVITVDTQTHRVSRGSWFRGRLYVMRCDVSFDGQFMVYLATGSRYDSWSGLCRLPWLTTLVHVEGIGANWGGGYFRSPRVLVTNGWRAETVSVSAEVPFKLAPGPLTGFMSDDLGILYRRFARDGFRRLGDNWGEEQTSSDPYRVTCVGDDGWGKRPSRHHPQLTVRYLGFINSAYRFAFSLDGHPDVLADASWATWDSGGDLWVARPGVVEQFTLKDLQRGEPSFALDVDRFEPPARAAKLLGL
jgi:hypothetical protein